MVDLDKRYSLKELIVKGIIPSTIINDIEIKDKIAQLQRGGMSHGRSVRYVAVEVGQTIQAIYASLKRNKL